MSAFGRHWHITSFCGSAVFGRFRSKADISWQTNPAGSVENDWGRGEHEAAGVSLDLRVGQPLPNMTMPATTIGQPALTSLFVRPTYRATNASQT